MNLLLDTHIALWAVTADERLSDKAARLIEDAGNSIAVSVATLWEISIKNALRQRRGNPLPFSAAQSQSLFEEAGFELLPVTSAHAVAVEALDPHHGDPFDRLLVAQAVTEPLRLMTADRLLARYGDRVILV